MKYLTTVNGQTFEIEVNQDGKITINGEERNADFQMISESLYSVLINNSSFEALVEFRDGRYNVLMFGEQYDVEVLDERQHRLSKASGGFGVSQGEIVIRSPM